MSSNSFGRLFKMTTFGESHGEGIGVVIDGCPPSHEFDINFIRKQLQRRRPGQSNLVTQRKEPDEIEVLSGVFEGKTTGAPICLFIRNTNQKPKDYSHNVDTFRPSHADFTYQSKYGIRDYRGGGRSSARETAARVAAGALAQSILSKMGVTIHAFVSKVHTIEVEDIHSVDLSLIDSNPVRCPDGETAKKMESLIKQTRKDGDTVGGTIHCVINGCPIGLGDPIYEKLHAKLGSAMLSINACKGFEYGSGFGGTRMKGSEHNDLFYMDGDSAKTSSNFSGGIQGGISNGMPIHFNVGFKPVATIMKNQSTINSNGQETEIEGKGRHDPCVLPRAVPIVESMAAMVILDAYLMYKAYH